MGGRGEGWRSLMGRKGGGGGGLDSGSGAGDWGREGLRVGGICHGWFVFVMGREMETGRVGLIEREKD